MQDTVVHPVRSQHRHHPTQSNRAAKIKSFIWHLFQMIIAMEIGMLLYHKIFVNQLAPISYKFVTIAYPLFDYWMMMIAMTLPMIGLMRYHKYDWRYCIGMTTAMLAPVVLLTALLWAGLISMTALKFLGSITMYLGMVTYMLFADKNRHTHVPHSTYSGMAA